MCNSSSVRERDQSVSGDPAYFSSIFLSRRDTIIEIKLLPVLWLPSIKSLFFTVSFKASVSLES